MVVHTQTERVKGDAASIMEFHLINHPLDCPVCDQRGSAGCRSTTSAAQASTIRGWWTRSANHKPKAVRWGRTSCSTPTRCILCSRCVRFCDEITGTGELGIFSRGDHSEIGLFSGQDLEKTIRATWSTSAPSAR